MTFDNLTDAQIELMLIDALRPNSLEYCTILIFALLLCVGLIGNFLVAFVVLRNASMRTATNIFLVNLASADFFVLLFCLPPTVLWDITKTWWFNTAACKAMMYCQNVSIAVSVLTLVAISTERWYAICNPLKFKTTMGWTKRVLACVWVAALLVALPEPIWDRTQTHQTIVQIQKTRPNFTTTWGQTCGPPWSVQTLRYYQWAILLLLFLIPLCVIAVVYGLIAHVLWAKSIPPSDRCETISNASCLNRASTSADISREKQVLSRRKAAKMLIAVVVLFAVCYFPVHLYNLLHLYGYITLKDSYALAVCKLVIRFLTYFNSCVNPCIYNFMSEKFQREFRRACCCLPQNYRRPQRAGLSHQESATLLMSNRPSKQQNDKLAKNAPKARIIPPRKTKYFLTPNPSKSASTSAEHAQSAPVTRKPSEDSLYQL